MKTEINLKFFMNSKCTAKRPLPKYISNQHRASTLTLSKVYSKVSFTEHTRYIPRNILKKNNNF